MLVTKMNNILALLFWVLLLQGSVIIVEGNPVKEKARCIFPAMYNFGDSNSDTGGISAVFKPIASPYGQTFFKKPAGRDSDGRLILDFIAEQIGLPYLSAYLNSLGANFSHGANFATGGSTIRRENETIFQNGISPFSLDVQIWHYDQLKSRSKDLYAQAGNSLMRSVLPRQEDFSKALYTFDIGQNDLSVAFRTMNDDQVRAAIPNIIDQFSSAVQHLYEEGARSFWIHNTGPIGCLPVQTFYNINPPPGVEDQYGCLNSQNAKAVEFNKQLKDAVTKLRTKLPEAAITYVDLYAAKYGLISKTKSLGWADPKKVCCGYHEKYDHVWCGTKGVIGNGTSVYGSVCSHPELHASWDGVHYTEAANHWFANHILNGSLSDPPVPISHACYRA
ncbi:GDSL esterase/lipase At5g14450 [Silene latifolia]|uniref:GDSL esterase/lipase At5g14450 n=1 Tax=Silene latifolia TaxID=37657 RepID=UPI003D77D87A